MPFVDEIIWEAKLCAKDQQKSRSANREQTKYYGKHKEYMVYCVTESVIAILLWKFIVKVKPLLAALALI